MKQHLRVRVLPPSQPQQTPMQPDAPTVTLQHGGGALSKSHARGYGAGSTKASCDDERREQSLRRG